jgi:hypothetical protein
MRRSLSWAIPILLVAALPGRAQVSGPNARRLQGWLVCADAPANLEALIWSAARGCWAPAPVSSSGTPWGTIGGTLGDQTDLQTVLDGKAPTAKGVTNGDAHDHAGGDGAAIPLATGASGVLPLANGGTGQDAWTAGRCVQVSAGGTTLESASAACGSGSGGGGGAPNYSQAFTAQTSVALTHGLGTPNLILACFDGSDNHLEPSGWTIAGAAPYAITVSFSAAQTGRCVVNGNGSSKYSAAFSSQTSISVPGTTHLLGTCDVHVAIFDAGSPSQRVEPNAVTCNSTTKDIALSFAVSQSGRYTIQ